MSADVSIYGAKDKAQESSRCMILNQTSIVAGKHSCFLPQESTEKLFGLYCLNEVGIELGSRRAPELAERKDQEPAPKCSSQINLHVLCGVSHFCLRSIFSLLVGGRV